MAVASQGMLGALALLLAAQPAYGDDAATPSTTTAPAAAAPHGAPAPEPQAPPAMPASTAAAHAGPMIADEAGVDVTIACRDPATEIFLAHGDVPGGTFPDPYERVGLTPIAIKLAPGTYSIETASPTQSTGHERFVVERGRPLHIEVRPGDAGVKSVGAVLAGLGVVSIVLGVVAIVSFSPNDQGYNRFGVGLPLIGAGAGVGGVGIAMTVLGATDVHVDRQPQPHAPAATVVPALRLVF